MASALAAALAAFSGPLVSGGGAVKTKAHRDNPFCRGAFSWLPGIVEEGQALVKARVQRRRRYTRPGTTRSPCHPPTTQSPGKHTQ